MDHNGKFLPPKDEAEFAARAQEISLEAATSILDSLKHRREALVASIDQEINFYEKVVKFREIEA